MRRAGTENRMYMKILLEARTERARDLRCEGSWQQSDFDWPAPGSSDWTFRKQEACSSTRAESLLKRGRDDTISTSEQRSGDLALFLWCRLGLGSKATHCVVKMSRRSHRVKHRVIDCSAVSPYRYGVGHDGYASAMTVRRRGAAAAEIACESERSRALTAESFGSMSAEITKQTSQRARSGAKPGAASAHVKDSDVGRKRVLYACMGSMRPE